MIRFTTKRKAPISIENMINIKKKEINKKINIMINMSQMTKKGKKKNHKLSIQK